MQLTPDSPLLNHDSMAPVATNEENGNDSVDRIAELKRAQAKPIEETRFINPFYSPSAGNENDNDYQYAKYKVSNLSRISISQGLTFRQALLPRCELGTTHRS